MATHENNYETPSDFRAFLRAELLRRLKSNPHYSMRAFARTLDYDVSSVSKMLKGKRKIGPKLIRKLGSKIGLDDQLIGYFILRESKEEVDSVQSNTPDFAALPIDLFSTISDWYHYAILELMYVPGFRPSPRWIAQALGLTVSEVEFAVHRLKRVGLLEVKNGKWREPKGDKITTLGPQATSFAARELQKSLLRKTIEAIEVVPIESRENSAVTMAIDTNKIAAAKQRIKLFRREMSHFLSRGGQTDDVYVLTIGLVPLTQLKRRKK